MAANTTGEWGELLDWPLIAIHSIVLQDGKVLTFGTDQTGAQGAMMYHDVWDPVTGEHHMIDHHMHTATDIFCAAAVILPGTNKVLIAGGDSRGEGTGRVNTGVNDVNLYDIETGHITPATDAEMNVARWYPTTISLPTGQVLIMGGTDYYGKGQATPEIYTPGEGWRSLTGATDPDVGNSSSYPKAWVGPDGRVYYMANGNAGDGKQEVMALDPTGEGSITEVAVMPTQINWTSPSIMFDTGKVLINDATTGLWVMDINGTKPTFEKVATLSQDRNYSNMTVLADGSVLINGGTSQGNKEIGADKTAVIWNPDTNGLTYTVDEDQPRLYHSTSVLLADGTVLSAGGGSAGSAENNYLDAQIYKPPYLFDENGNEAVRPEVTDVPDTVRPGQTFTIDVSDANAISSLQFVKNGATTHNLNVDARAVELDFVVVDNNTLEVTLPDNANVVTAGSWMLFAWDDAGVPSVAPILQVEPREADFDGIGDVTAEYFAAATGVDALDQIDFENGDVIHLEKLDRIDEETTGSFHEGGRTDNFGVRYTAPFEAPESGQYTFHLTSDDGSRLLIDGEEVINNDGLHGITEKTVTVFLEAGSHDMKLLYFERGGLAKVDLDWSGPGFDRRQMTFDGAEENGIRNGGFESVKLADDTWQVGNHLGWEVTGNGNAGIQNLKADHIEEIGSHANNVLYVHSGSGMRQITDTTFEEGRIYRLTADIGNRSSLATDIDGAAMRVYVGGVMVAELVGVDATEGKWSTEALEFRSEDFKDLGLYGQKIEVRLESDIVSGSGQVVFDNVHLTSTPDESQPVDPGTGGNVIEAGDNGGWFDGTDSDDTFIGGAGLDVFHGGKGNDTYDGAGGDYNQVDFDGAADEYTFTKNADGTVTASHPVYGTDTLKNISGAWFYGEAKWYALDSLLTVDPTNPVNEIIADDAGGYVQGTAGSDKFIGGAGNDVFNGLGGGDIIDGGAGDYNQVDYNGRSTDYTFTRNDDGTVKVTHADGTVDTLTNIDGIWFNGDAKWAALSDLVEVEPGTVNIINAGDAGGYFNGTAGDDEFRGGAGVDVFNGGKGNDVYYGGGGEYNQVDLQGNRADYTFSQNADGSVTASHAEFGEDILHDIDGIWFVGDAEWIPIDAA